MEKWRRRRRRNSRSRRAEDRGQRAEDREEDRGERTTAERGGYRREDRVVFRLTLSRASVAGLRGHTCHS